MLPLTLPRRLPGRGALVAQQVIPEPTRQPGDAELLLLGLVLPCAEGGTAVVGR